MKLDFKPSDKRDPCPAKGQTLLNEALDKCGVEDQMRRTQEECALLISAINKHLREDGPVIDLAGQVAEALILVSSVAEVIERRSPGLVDGLLGQKLHKLQNHLESLSEETPG